MIMNRLTTIIPTTRLYSTRALIQRSEVISAVDANINKPSLFTRLQYFAIGFAISAGYGLYSIEEKVEKHSLRIEDSLSNYRKDAERAQQLLRRRVVALETEIGRNEVASKHLFEDEEN